MKKERDRAAIEYSNENDHEVDLFEEETSLTSALCLSMTCGCFTLMCGMIGAFYVANLPEEIRPKNLKSQNADQKLQ